jgi:CheY-like chemotaxis protein
LTESTCDVLVVDDETDTVFLAQRILERENFTVMTASNGEEALQLIQEQNLFPRLILLDIQMPRVDGLKVLETLRADDRFDGIIILIFTIRNVTKDAELAKQLGADGYITKPFKAASLVKTIREKLQENGDI